MKMIEVQHLCKEYKRKIVQPGLIGGVKGFLTPQFDNFCAVDDINFQIERGESVGYVGPNGSGKSTILELLLRFYEPEEGEILCNGENIKVLKLSEYRSLFSVVSQKSALFLGDIVQNIDLEGKADRQKLNEVLRKSGVKKYLQRFPEKEKTQIGDDGAFLSGGERQKLVVARALLKDAPVMLFDEASSGFDVEANEYIYKIITEEMPEKSVIFITHHYDKLEKCRGD